MVKKKKTKKKVVSRKKPQRAEEKKDGRKNDSPRFATGQQALLHYIIEKHGGPAAVAEVTGLRTHIVFNWRARGQVPLAYTKRFADALDIPTWGLNYADLAFFNGKYDSWERVVRRYKLPRKIVESILFLAPPNIKSWG